MPYQFTPKDITRLWATAKLVGECWIWTHRPNSSGYGNFGAGGYCSWLAHRVAWEVTNGPIPDGMCICHDCPGGDNPMCINPAHLWLGTVAENVADRDAKGRTARGLRSGAYTHPERVPRGDRHGSRLHPEQMSRGDDHWMRKYPERRQGERNPCAKLTNDQVRQIRALWAATPRHGVKAALARRFRVSKVAIGLILSGKKWQHVT